MESLHASRSAESVANLPSKFGMKQTEVANAVQKVMNLSYAVKEGDTIESIARQIGVSSDRLKASLLLGVRSLTGKVVTRIGGMVEIISLDGKQRTRIPVASNDERFQVAA